MQEGAFDGRSSAEAGSLVAADPWQDRQEDPAEDAGHDPSRASDQGIDRHDREIGYLWAHCLEAERAARRMELGREFMARRMAASLDEAQMRIDGIQASTEQIRQQLALTGGRPARLLRRIDLGLGAGVALLVAMVIATGFYQFGWTSAQSNFAALEQRLHQQDQARLEAEAKAVERKRLAAEELARKNQLAAHRQPTADEQRQATGKILAQLVARHDIP